MNGDELVQTPRVIETVESDDVIMPGDYMLRAANLEGSGGRLRA